MSTNAQEWAKSYFSRLDAAIEQLKNHDLVSTVNVIKYTGVTDEKIAEIEAKIYEEQIERTEMHGTDAPEEPFAFNEYLKEFYKISNGLHISWHSVAFPETEALDPNGEFPIATDEDDYKEGWISIVPLEGLAGEDFGFSGDPNLTTYGESEEMEGGLFTYLDGFNYYNDTCIALRNGNHIIAFGDDHSASYDEPHACDFVIYMEYALSTFFAVECRARELKFSNPDAMHPILQAMVDIQDYSDLEALLENNDIADIDSVIAFEYNEKGNQYADQDYLANLPETVTARLEKVIGNL